MAIKDELKERRFRNLVGDLRSLMSGSLKPEYRGFYGQLVLGSQSVSDLGELEQVRRAARAAGRELGWRVRTYVSNEVLIILDTREAPENVQQLAERHAAEAVGRILFPNR